MVERITKQILVSFLIIQLIMTGCLGWGSWNGDTSPEHPPFGIGLEIPSSLPEPGPFIEGESIRDYEEFLTREGQEILTDCGKPQEGDVIEYYLDREMHSLAFFSLIDGCTTNKYLEVTDNAIRDGNEEQIYHEWSYKAENSLERAKESISEHPGPGNAIEVTVMAHLMRKAASESYTITHSVPRLWEPYANATSRDELQLSNVFLNLVRPVERLETLEIILDRYPWQDLTCTIDDFDSIADRTRANIDRALMMAKQYGHDKPREDGSMHARYNSLDLSFIPEFEDVVERGWWPRLLFLEVSSITRPAYWDSFTASAWPTQEEAEFLLAQHRSEYRSIWTERALFGFIEHFESDNISQHSYDWETDIEGGAPYFLGRMLLYSPLEDFQCHN